MPQSTKKMQKKEVAQFFPKRSADWRKWLEKNHRLEHAVWLVFHSKLSKYNTHSSSDAADVALCFGWIDRKRIKIDEENSQQFFSKRKPKRTGSKINKEKVAEPSEDGGMTEAGI